MKDRNTIACITDHFPLLLGSSIYRPNRLFFKGNLPEGIGVAMVGTRRPSSNGRELCRRLVKSLKGTKAVVVSGLAQGIDFYCHEAALDFGIPTVAVLAQGLEAAIQGSRKVLAERILEEGGAIVSEYEGDFASFKGCFVARNKIISGLSKCTVIVQSKVKGGALLTGEFTRQEGKPLYACPGDFDSEVAGGTNQLLDQGLASPVFVPENLYKVLGLPRSQGQSIAELETAGCNLTQGAKDLFFMFRGFRKTFTEIQSTMTLPTPQLLAILTELEIAGLAQSSDNFQFYFNGEP